MLTKRATNRLTAIGPRAVTAPLATLVLESHFRSRRYSVLTNGSLPFLPPENSRCLAVGSQPLNGSGQEAPDSPPGTMCMYLCGPEPTGWACSSALLCSFMLASMQGGGIRQNLTVCPYPYLKPCRGRVQLLHKFVHPAHGGVGEYSARMCLACAHDLMSPSMHSWHERDSIDVAFAQVEEELVSAE
jgi:hypothetical protein